MLNTHKNSIENNMKTKCRSDNNWGADNCTRKKNKNDEIVKNRKKQRGMADSYELEINSPNHLNLINVSTLSCIDPNSIYMYTNIKEYYMYKYIRIFIN